MGKMGHFLIFYPKKDKEFGGVKNKGGPKNNYKHRNDARESLC